MNAKIGRMIYNRDMKQRTKIGRYTPSDFEPKWRTVWAENDIYKFSLDPKKKTYYPLVELPYPSGDLHIGHWFSFATADVHARVHRMKGENVFFTNGFDAFGLPAENAAIKRNIHPQDWTMSNIASMEKQFATMGTMIDWSHETITCLPEYYRWNQWIFTRLFEKGFAYRDKMLTNWCPVDKTVLANENIENGKCWRCGTEVVQKEVEQWFIKITALADELMWKEADEKGLSNGVNWPTSVKVAQNQWIGKKEGIEITYPVVLSDSKESNLTVTIFTTRPDTNYGATFVAIAPEHPLVEEILKQIQDEQIKKNVREYVEAAGKKTELDRMAEGMEKSGAFTGAYAVNHLTGYRMPIWVSDFVLSNFGTGALVGVPGHDMRDFQFAKKFDLEIKRVVVGSDGDTSEITTAEQVQEEEGTMINSDFLNSMDIHDATEKIIDYMEEKGWGKRTVTYHIHDWSISRQRYWGTPVPMIHCDTCGIVPVPDEELPVVLPYDVDFAPKGEPPLASNKDWLHTTCPKCGGEARRDAETLDTFFDSSWYFWRYLNPHFDKAPFDDVLVREMMPVDIYFGGSEHTLGHTLYARFFTKFFKMLGMTELSEFAAKRVQHGVILGPDGNRMSKSKGNVINPDDVVREYGTDAARMYLCFMMPYDATAPWDPKGIWGVYRFLKRVWDLAEKVNYQEGVAEVERTEGSSLAEQAWTGGDDRQGPMISTKDRVVMNKTIKKVGDDAGATKFNTAVSELMKWLNYLEAKETVGGEEYHNLLLILAPFAPHMTEELWQKFFSSDERAQVGAKFSRAAIEMSKPKQGASADSENSASSLRASFVSIHQQPWPEVDEQYLVEETVTVAVQINGKMRGTITLSSEEMGSKEKAIEMATSEENIFKHLDGKTAKTVVYVPGKILNFVLG